MAERPRDRSRLSRAKPLVAVALAAWVVVLGAMVLEREDPCDAPSAAPAAETELMPAGLSFDRIATVTNVRRDERYITVNAVTTKPVDEATVLIQDAVTAAGYRPAGMDSEGLEAEVFFTTGLYAAGGAHVRQSACAGRRDIDLVLLDRDALPSASTVPTTTG